MQPIFRDLHIHTYSDAERSVQGYDVAILIRRPNRGSKPRRVIWQGQPGKLSEWERLSQSVYCRSNENPRICNPGVTRRESEGLLSRTPDSIKYHLARLTEQGFIKREGPDKGRRWIVLGE